MSTLESDWDRYYSDEALKVPDFIVNTLWKNYRAVLRKNLDTSRPLIVAELGGANSCFFERFKNEFPIQEYHILDNNRLGLSLFEHKNAPEIDLHHVDLLSSPDSLGISADVVLSSGLIEHFHPAETKRIIDVHFRLAKSNGLVLMSFPTPTLVYWGFRRALEMMKRFPPLFERPLRRSEIYPVLADHGTPLEIYKIWTTLLTQYLTLTRKSGRFAVPRP